MAQNTVNTEGEINLLDVFKVFIHRWWAIALAAILGAGIMFCYTYFMTEQKYEAKVMMYVNTKNDLSLGNYSVSMSEINVSRSLVDTYTVIAKRRETIRSVVNGAVIYYENGTYETLKEKYAKQGLDASEIYDYKTLTKNISVGDENNTEIFSVKVQANDPDDAMAIANAYVEIFPKDVGSIIEGADARMVEYAETATPLSRNYGRNIAIGFLAGAVLVAAAVFVIDYLINDIIDSEDWIRNSLGDEIPLLTVIPDDETGNGKYGSYGKYSYYKYNYKYGYDSKPDVENNDEGGEA